MGVPYDQMAAAGRLWLAHCLVGTNLSVGTKNSNSRLKEARKLRFEVREYSHVWAGRACSEHDELLAGGAPCGSSAGRRVHRPRRLWDMHAIEASELARKMPPGPGRNDALKATSQLRCSADASGTVFTKRGRPRGGAINTCMGELLFPRRPAQRSESAQVTNRAVRA